MPSPQLINKSIYLEFKTNVMLRNKYIHFQKSTSSRIFNMVPHIGMYLLEESTVINYEHEMPCKRITSTTQCNSNRYHQRTENTIDSIKYLDLKKALENSQFSAGLMIGGTFSHITVYYHKLIVPVICFV
jgi:hypothetical protein